MNKTSTGLLVVLTVLGLGGATFALACSDDDTVVQPSGPDGSVTDSAADTSRTPDGGSDVVTVIDAGPDVFEAGKPDANDGGEFFCPIVGDNTWQAGIGTGSCNTCVRTYCCGAITTCLAGEDAGVVGYLDGGHTPCNDRLECQIFNPECGPTAADAGGCIAACDSQFPAAANTAAKELVRCAFDPKTAPAPTGCSKRADGGNLCYEP